MGDGFQLLDVPLSPFRDTEILTALDLLVALSPFGVRQSTFATLVPKETETRRKKNIHL